jgi:glutamate racemase
VRRFLFEIMDFLCEQEVKMIIIACNTATAAGLQEAKKRYDVPVIGVIGTRATITSRSYDDAFSAAPQVELTTAACPRFVEFVEAGVTSGPDLLEVAHEYLDPLVSHGIDTLILGCTHYPLLTGVISYVMGDQVTLVSSAEETAKDVYKLLVRHGRERDPDLGPPRHQFLTTGQPEEFASIGRRFLGPEMQAVHQFAEMTARVRP